MQTEWSLAPGPTDIQFGCRVKVRPGVWHGGCIVAMFFLEEGTVFFVSLVFPVGSAPDILRVLKPQVDTFEDFRGTSLSSETHLSCLSRAQKFEGFFFSQDLKVHRRDKMCLFSCRCNSSGLHFFQILLIQETQQAREGVLCFPTLTHTSVHPHSHQCSLTHKHSHTRHTHIHTHTRTHTHTHTQHNTMHPTALNTHHHLYAHT